MTLSRSTFPNRLPHEAVLERFKALWKNEQSEQEKTRLSSKKNNKGSDKRALVESMLTFALKELEKTLRRRKNGKMSVVKAFVVGNTLTYFHVGALEYLETQRLKQLGQRAAHIQRTVRGFHARKNYQRLYGAVVLLDSLAFVR